MTIDVKLYFNFRSPYCYLLSTHIFKLDDEFNFNWLWRPLGGWNGRSAPDRVVKKLPLVRQDVARWCKRYGIPMNPPPKTTDPTKAGAASLFAQEQGVLKLFIIETMKAEWAEGLDIGQDETLKIIAERVGLSADAIINAANSPHYLKQLDNNTREAEKDGVMGVPTIVIGTEIFWGNDRVDFVKEYLISLGAKK